MSNFLILLAKKNKTRLLNFPDLENSDISFTFNCHPNKRLPIQSQQ